jgi:hypothetical protein
MAGLGLDDRQMRAIARVGKMDFRFVIVYLRSVAFW